MFMPTRVRNAIQKIADDNGISFTEAKDRYYAELKAAKAAETATEQPVVTPVAEAPAETQGDLSDAGFAWVKENGKRWKKNGYVRYYLNDLRAILAKADWRITEERKGGIERIEGLSKNKTFYHLRMLDKTYYDAINGILVGEGPIFEDLRKALQEV